MRKKSVEKHAIEEAKQWVDDRLGNAKISDRVNFYESPIRKN
jgi:hypothetical protein